MGSTPTLDLNHLQTVYIGLIRGSMLTGLKNQFLCYKLLKQIGKAFQGVMKLCRYIYFIIIILLQLESEPEGVAM